MDLLNYTPKKEFTHKHLLSLIDYDQDDILQLLSLGLKLKKDLKSGTPHATLNNKILGMIFTKSSTRTRVSFEVGIKQLGGTGLFLSSNDIQLGRGETIHDTAKVLSRYIDAIMIRTFKQSDVEDLAKYGSIPIINGLTDLVHPCQALADMMTFYEQKNDFAGKKLAFIGDGNNVYHSLALIGAKLGMEVSLAAPNGYMPDKKIVNIAESEAEKYNGKITITTDPKEAIKNADCVYTDVWTSMGQENENKKRMEDFCNYQVNSELFDYAKSDAIFLHCLPAHRGEEVTAEVIDGKNSYVFDQAENRLHAQKAVMALLMK